MNRINNFFVCAVLAIDGLVCMAGGNNVRGLFHIPMSYQGIGNRKMDLYIRTSSPYNLTDLNPLADWTKVGFMSASCTLKAKIGAAAGYTVVSNGCNDESYKWRHDAPDIVTMGYRYTLLGNYCTFLLYNAFIRAEKEVYSAMKKKCVKVMETDTTIIYDISGDIHDKTLFGLSVASETLSGKYRMQNIISKENNLLLSFKLWGTQRNGDNILLIFTDNIRYNVKNEADAYIQSGYIRPLLPAMTKKREIFLREESAPDAALRILTALTAGDSLELREAMCAYDIPKHIRQYKGSLITKVKQMRSKCQDVIFAYKMAWPKGAENNTQMQRRRIYLRYDTRNKLWRVNGGV